MDGARIQESQVPLCVDLDGTLVRGDTLAESVLRLARTSPLSLLRLPAWLARGRAALKQEISDRVSLDPGSLPYNDELLAYLRGEHDRGRPILLVTAAHVRIARAVSDHLALFDEVIATDGETNLKGTVKRAELERRFGEGGFDYAGDSPADLAVWPGAREAIVVNASPRVVRKLGDRATRILDTPSRRLPRLVLNAIRTRQWVKNLLLFLPLLLAHRYLEAATLIDTALAFFSFSFGASAVYVLNDLLDVEADRAHPGKRRRPFASGELPLLAGLLMIPLLLAASLLLAFVLPGRFFGVLLVYFMLTTLYSFLLKELALIDVLLLASLYTLRIIAGSAAGDVEVSEWLLGFSMFLFLSLAAVKRYAELLRLRRTDGGKGPEPAKIKGRGYFSGDLELIVQMGIAAGYIAVLVLALYISSDVVTRLYGQPRLLWLVCPLILFWVSRIWLLAHRGILQEDPVSFSVHDRVTWAVALVGSVIILAARGG